MVVRCLSWQALWVRSQTSPTYHKGVTFRKHRSGQHTLARQKNIFKTPIEYYWAKSTTDNRTGDLHCSRAARRHLACNTALFRCATPPLSYTKPPHTYTTPPGWATPRTRLSYTTPKTELHHTPDWATPCTRLSLHHIRVFTTFRILEISYISNVFFCFVYHLKNGPNFAKFYEIFNANLYKIPQYFEKFCDLLYQFF